MKLLLQCGTSVYDFDKRMADFKSKPTPNNKSTLYFIPWDELTEKAQKNMTARRVSEPDSDAADIVEDILGDVSGAEFAVTSEERLREAQIANTEARTRMLSEKLQRNRQEIWNSWNEQFFECFSKSFAKLKNTLVSLQLNEDQLQTLNEALDSALSSMKDKLDFMYNDFMEKGLDDKEEDDLLNGDN